MNAKKKKGKNMVHKYPTLRDAEIYVSTRKKEERRDGENPGWWLRVADYGSHAEFTEACKELHKDEERPEPRFPYSKNVPECLIDDEKVNPALFELCAVSKEIDGEEEEEAFSRWCDNAPIRDLTDTSMSTADKFSACYVGKFDSKEDFAAHLLDATGHGLPDFARMYFDYSKYAKDLLATDYYNSGLFYYQHY